MQISSTNFKCCLVSGLSGAMSNISVGRNRSSQQESPGDPTAPQHTNDHTEPSGPDSAADDFHCFILDEMSRRCGGSSRKRTTAPSDSPSRKRMRLWYDTDEDDTLC